MYSDRIAKLRAKNNEALNKHEVSLTESYHYDKRKVFQDNIAPIVDKLQALCEEHNIPMVAFLQLTHESDKVILEQNEYIPLNTMIAHDLIAVMGFRQFPTDITYTAQYRNGVAHTYQERLDSLKIIKH